MTGETGTEAVVPNPTPLAPTAVEVPNPPSHRILEDLDPVDFYNVERPLMDPTIIFTVAKSYGIEPEALIAFGKIESPKGPYMADGRPYILYEAHVFSRLTGHKFDESHPTLSSAKWNKTLYGAGGDHQYQRLYKAMGLDQSAALKACSWGAYQILGENHKVCGFETVEDFVQYMVASEANQFDVFIRFLVKRNITAALRSKDWDTAFYKYNGPAFRTHGYDVRFMQIYNDLTSNVLREGSSGPDVTDLQKMLVKFGQTVEITGFFGIQTKTGVENLQKKWGLKVDGVVGAATYKRLAAERTNDETTPIASKRGLGAGAAIVTGGTMIANAATDTSTQEATKTVDLLDQLKNVTDISGTAKQVIATARDASEQMKVVSSGLSTTMIILGIAVIMIGIYIYWTKYHDNKKSAGVTTRAADTPSGAI